MLRYRQSSDMEMGGRVRLNCFRASIFIISEFCRHLVKMADSNSRNGIVVKMRPRCWICSHPSLDSVLFMP
jgi:hypothetical protein